MKNQKTPTDRCVCADTRNHLKWVDGILAELNEYLLGGGLSDDPDIKLAVQCALLDGARKELHQIILDLSNEARAHLQRRVDEIKGSGPLHLDAKGGRA